MKKLTFLLLLFLIIFNVNALKTIRGDRVIADTILILNDSILLAVVRGDTIATKWYVDNQFLSYLDSIEILDSILAKIADTSEVLRTDLMRKDALGDSIDNRNLEDSTTIDGMIKAIAADSNYLNSTGDSIYPKIATKLGIDTTYNNAVYFNANYIKYLTDSLYHNAVGSHIWDISGTEKMRLDINGHLCIGCDSAFKHLDVRGGNIVNTTNDWRLLHTGSYLQLKLGSYTGNTYGAMQVGISGGISGGVLSFNPSGGYVGVATLTPNQELDINGSMNVSDTAFTNSLSVTNNANIGDTTFTDVLSINPNNDRFHVSAGNLVLSVASSFFQIEKNTDIVGDLSINGTAALGNNDTDDTLLVAIGYNALLNENSTISADYKFTSAKTYYYSINPNNFISINPYVDQITYDNTYVQADEDAVIFYCPINLPHGAIITSINIKSNVSDEQYFLYRNDFAASASQMATANFNTADVSISNAIIDNANYTYSISTSSIDNTDRIYGGVIIYTLSEL